MKDKKWKSVKVLERKKVVRLQKTFIAHVKKEEQKMLKKRNRNIELIVVCLAIFFLFIYFLNEKVGYTADDYTYHFFYDTYLPTEHTRPIKNLFDVFNSQVNHYNKWNGRFVAHTLVQIFMQFNKSVFNVCNSFAYIGLIVLMNKIVASCNKTKVLLPNILLTFFLLWFFIPEFGKTVLWVSGSFNYLWMALIYLSLILVFISKKDRKSSMPFLVSVSFLAFLSGATNENSGLASIGICLLLCLYFSLLKGKIALWQVSAIFFGFLGSFVLLSAPGTKNRNNFEFNLTIFKENLENIGSTYLHQFGYLLLLFILLLIIALLLKIIDSQTVIFSSFFFLGALASIFGLSFSSEAPLRAFFGTACFIIIPTLLIFSKIVNSFQENRNFRIFLTCFFVSLSVMFLISYTKVYSDNSQTYDTFLEGVAEIEKAKKEGAEKVYVLKPISYDLYNAYFETGNLSDSPHEWFNEWMAKYYNVDAIYGYVK